MSTPALNTERDTEAGGGGLHTIIYYYYHHHRFFSTSEYVFSSDHFVERTTLTSSSSTHERRGFHFQSFVRCLRFGFISLEKKPISHFGVPNAIFPTKGTLVIH